MIMLGRYPAIRYSDPIFPENVKLFHPGTTYVGKPQLRQERVKYNFCDAFQERVAVEVDSSKERCN